ncbi:MAG: hypothetical protein M1828_005778 [Chrysothrix sp. TS-e1954]|nr:MAG: hypothetical protein M1828_005778 [Chrysothrix sp. TS-e1954]
MDWILGQLFMMGFEGTSVTDHIKDLIESHHLGSILLTTKNLECTLNSAQQTTRLVYDLQLIAFNSGHPMPLNIALAQENGGINTLSDENHIRQYPSAMGLAATGSPDLTFHVARASAEELAACGKHDNQSIRKVILIPTQPLGVRAFSDDPQQVSTYANASLRGYKAAGLMTLGKHFPSYGNLDFLESSLGVPTITDSLEQLTHRALVPFRHAVEQGIDAVMVGGCALDSADLQATHACLSEEVINHLLRADLGFNGVVLSECLEMEAFSHTVGVGSGTVMALKAGCDIALLCRSPEIQLEAIESVKNGIDNSSLPVSRVQEAFERVMTMKTRCTTCDWEHALNPPGVDRLINLQPLHTTLSTRAYNKSISIVRDRSSLLPLTNTLKVDEALLVLTPLVKPLAASVATGIPHNGRGRIGRYTRDKCSSVVNGESVFKGLGRALARQRHRRVLHTSYTASGVLPVHENLISKAGAVVLLTADTNRHHYQSGFTKHISTICKLDQSLSKNGKPLIVVSVSSPYEFAFDPGTVGTLICTYEFTETALRSLVGILYGNFVSTGCLPGSISKTQKLHQSRQHWLVEYYNEDRDADALDALIGGHLSNSLFEGRSCIKGCTAASFTLKPPNVTGCHFVVRSTNLQTLHGFCATYHFKNSHTGVISCLIVDSTKRSMSIGTSLHTRAIDTLLEQDGIQRLQIGSRLPSIYLGIPKGRDPETRKLRTWFANLGWKTSFSRPTCSMIARDLTSWSSPEGMTRNLANAQRSIEFDLVYGHEAYGQSILDHVASSTRQGVAEIYKLALADPRACGIIRAKQLGSGLILGTLVLYNNQSRLASFVPALDATNDVTGGMSCPVISPSTGEHSTLLNSLILLGMRQIQEQGCDSCLLDCMDKDGNLSLMWSMGFEMLHEFEEISCDAATWSLIPST